MTNLPKHPQHCQAGRRSFNPVGLLHELGPKKRVKMVAFTIIHHYLGETCNLSTRFINPRLTLKQKDDCLHVWFQPIPKSGHTPPATSQGQGGSDGYTHCPIYIDTCIHIISMENMLKVCICICIYVYMYICIYVYMYICIYVYMYICIYVYVYICIYVYMCIYVYICVYVYMYICIYVYMYICIYVYMCICVYVYVYVYVCTNSVYNYSIHCTLCPQINLAAMAGFCQQVRGLRSP